MSEPTLADVLEAEHHEIDAGIHAFLGGADDGRDRLAAVFEELRRHIYLEEVYLFPPLTEADLVAPVFVMLREHGEMWQTLEEIEAAVTVDAASDSVAALCTSLLTQLDAHNSKEEPILYPELTRTLTDSAQDQSVAFLEGGERPDGWECSRAQAGAPVTPPWV